MLATLSTEYYLEVTVVLCWAGLVTTIQVDTATQLLSEMAISLQQFT